MRRFDPEGESTYSIVFAKPLGLDDVLALFSGYEVFIHELYYVIAKKGRIYNHSIEDIETRDGIVRENIEDLLSEELDSPYDWYLPALAGVSSSGNPSRSFHDVRFLSAKIQIGHIDATRLWADERELQVALTPLRPIGRLSPTQAELRAALD